MNSKLFLPSILFVLLLIGGPYYYVCKIKQICPEASAKSPIAEGFDPYLDTTSQPTLQPLTFNFNSVDPIIGEGFDDMRFDLISKIGEKDTLMVLGTYYTAETGGEELGISRAKLVKSLLIDYFDSNRIQIQSLHNDLTHVEENSRQEAIQFNIISATSDTNEMYTDLLVDPTTSTDEPRMVEILGEKIIIHFPAGSVRKIITSEVEQYLDQLVSDLEGVTTYKVFVEGHSDNSGSEDENYQLGRKRAWALKKLMWDKGLEPGYIITSSKGELEPIKDNETDEGRAYNRRVEITISID